MYMLIINIPHIFCITYIYLQIYSTNYTTKFYFIDIKLNIGYIDFSLRLLFVSVDCPQDFLLSNI